MSDENKQELKCPCCGSANTFFRNGYRSCQEDSCGFIAYYPEWAKVHRAMRRMNTRADSKPELPAPLTATEFCATADSKTEVDRNMKRGPHGVGNSEGVLYDGNVEESTRKAETLESVLRANDTLLAEYKRLLGVANDTLRTISKGNTNAQFLVKQTLAETGVV